MRIIKWFRSRLTMKITGTLFVDSVSGKSVFNAVDCYGNEYMTDTFNVFGFRVKKEK